MACASEATDYPQDEAGQSGDEQQITRPLEGGVAPIGNAQPVGNGLGVAEVLLDLHAGFIQAHELLGGVSLQGWGGDEQPRFAAHAWRVCG